MRQPRLTYPGAFHHCMNRGIQGESIFPDDERKTVFIDLLAEKVRMYRMRLFAFCVMDNHYHLVLQNTSGRMSDFFRNLNTQYAYYFRKTFGGNGYVFQSRFQSTLVQDDSYLMQAIVYTLQNPLRAGLAVHYREYLWSSGRMFAEKVPPDWLDVEYVLDLFDNLKGLTHAVQTGPKKELPLLSTSFGTILGEKKFLEKAIERFERRHRPDPVKMRRKDDFSFDPVEKVIWEFERYHKVKIKQICPGNLEGKRWRSDLLVRLHDRAGLTFREIHEFPLYAELRYKSLSQLYLNAKKKSN